MVQPRLSLHSVIEDLAAAVRELWCRWYPLKCQSVRLVARPWRGSAKFETGGRRGESAWVHAAKFILQHGLAPAEFVHFAVIVYAPSVVPLPTVLYSGKVLEAFRRYTRSDQYRESSADALRRQATVLANETAALLASGMAADEIKASLLLDDTVNLSPLFCYCVATQEQLFDIAEARRAEAMAQFLSDPRGYLADWPRVLPAEFDAVAARLYKLVASADGGRE